MSDSTQVISERGTLPALAAGQSTTFNTTLRAANGDFLPVILATCVAAGVVATAINNVPNPTLASQITFTNLSGLPVPAGAPYLLEYVHSIQLDPLQAVVSRAANPVVAAGPNTCEGLVSAGRLIVPQVKPLGAAVFIGFDTLLGIFGSMGANIALAAGNLVLPDSTVTRSWRIQARIPVLCAAAEAPLSADLLQDPLGADGGPFTLQSGLIDFALGEEGILNFDTTHSVLPGSTPAQRTIGIRVNATVGAVDIGRTASGDMNLIISSI